MDKMDLDVALERARCPRCEAGRIRPIEIESKRLRLNCSAPKCAWRGEALLPLLPKTVMYLDTSTVSHIARASEAGRDGSVWQRLYDALQTAIANEALCCPVSSIVRSEAELATSAEAIVAVAEGLSDPGLRHQLDVEQRQLFRALARFLSGAPPVLEMRLPSEDAFEDDIRSWRPLFGVHVNSRYPARLVESMRLYKATVHTAIQGIYRQYADEELGFEQMRQREARGFGQGQIADGLRSMERRGLCFAGELPPDDSVGDMCGTTLECIAKHIRCKREMSCQEALTDRRIKKFMPLEVASQPV